LPLKFVPNSLFALDSSLIWAVSAKEEVWFSDEGGLAWRKLGRAKNAARVHFLDEKNGFAVGVRKTALRTRDGGKTWDTIPEAAQTIGHVDTTAFNWVCATGPRLVSIFGNTQAMRRSRYYGPEPPPEWMDPEKARDLREAPSITVSLDSKDRGQTFKAASVSAFGNVHRVRVAADGQGLILLRFERYFPYGGELYRFRTGGDSKIERVLRTENDTLQDAVWIPGDGAYVAMTARPGKMMLPVPGAVKVVHSRDLETWTEIPVDYRAEGSTAFFGAAGGKLMLATSDGMILELAA
jgi:hypothetical protein